MFSFLFPDAQTAYQVQARVEETIPLSLWGPRTVTTYNDGREYLAIGGEHFEVAVAIRTAARGLGVILVEGDKITPNPRPHPLAGPYGRTG